jgi:hypothetical protein
MTSDVVNGRVRDGHKLTRAWVEPSAALAELSQQLEDWLSAIFLALGGDEAVEEQQQ